MLKPSCRYRFITKPISICCIFRCYSGSVGVSKSNLFLCQTLSLLIFSSYNVFCAIQWKQSKALCWGQAQQTYQDIRCTWKADNHRLRWKTWREVKFGLTLDRNFFKTKAHFSFFKTTFINVSASCEEDSLFWSLILYVQKLRTRPGEYVKPQ